MKLKQLKAIAENVSLDPREEDLYALFRRGIKAGAISVDGLGFSRKNDGELRELIDIRVQPDGSFIVTADETCEMPIEYDMRRMRDIELPKIKMLDGALVIHNSTYSVSLDAYIPKNCLGLGFVSCAVDLDEMAKSGDVDVEYGTTFNNTNLRGSYVKSPTLLTNSINVFDNIGLLNAKNEPSFDVLSHFQEEVRNYMLGMCTYSSAVQIPTNMLRAAELNVLCARSVPPADRISPLQHEAWSRLAEQHAEYSKMSGRQRILSAQRLLNSIGAGEFAVL